MPRSSANTAIVSLAFIFVVLLLGFFEMSHLNTWDKLRASRHCYYWPTNQGHHTRPHRRRGTSILEPHVPRPRSRGKNRGRSGQAPDAAPSSVKGSFMPRSRNQAIPAGLREFLHIVNRILGTAFQLARLAYHELTCLPSALWGIENTNHRANACADRKHRQGAYRPVVTVTLLHDNPPRFLLSRFLLFN